MHDDDIALAFDLEVVADNGKMARHPLGIARLAQAATFDEWIVTPFREDGMEISAVAVKNVRWVEMRKLHEGREGGSEYRSLADAVAGGIATTCKDGGTLTLAAVSWHDIQRLRWHSRKRLGDNLWHHYELSAAKTGAIVEIRYGENILPNPTWSDDDYRRLDVYQIPIDALGGGRVIASPARWGDATIQTGDDGRGEQQRVTIEWDRKCVSHVECTTRNGSVVELGRGQDDLVVFEAPDATVSALLIAGLRGLLEVTEGAAASSAVPGANVTQEALRAFLGFAHDAVKCLPPPMKSGCSPEYEVFYERRDVWSSDLINGLNKLSGDALRQATEKLIVATVGDLDVALVALARDIEQRELRIKTCEEKRLCDRWSDELEQMRDLRRQVKAIVDKVQARKAEIGK